LQMHSGICQQQIQLELF